MHTATAVLADIENGTLLTILIVLAIVVCVAWLTGWRHR